MLNTYISIVNSDIFLAFLGATAFALLFLFAPRPKPRDKRGFDSPDFLRRKYWLLMLLAGALLAVLAIWFYLFKIGLSVGNLVDTLLAKSRDAQIGKDDSEVIRNLGQATALLLGALAASATLIFQLVRVWTTERQTVAAEEGLITERINKAVENLGAEKSVKRQRKNSKGKLLYRKDKSGNLIFEDPVMEEVTEPNLEVRIGAIYALERIAQDSPRDHIQVMEILCAYIRENAKAEDAPRSPHEVFEELTEDGDGVQGLNAETAFQDKRFKRVNRYGWNPTDLTIDNLNVWARGLPPPRTDIQTALDVIGRRDDAQIAIERAARVRGSKVGYRLDLRATNLQKADLSELALDHALLTGARMEGAYLGGARMEGADLSGARMEGANLGGARMEGANLGGARMEGADLSGARMEGAYLTLARMEGADLRWARMEGADLRRARMEGADLERARMEGADLRWARMEGADLERARMEGADLRWARFDEKTNFTAVLVQYAAVKSSPLVGMALDQDQVNTLFGDGSVTLPPGLARPAHWPEDDLGWQDFRDQWCAWQRENGYTPRE